MTDLKAFDKALDDVLRAHDEKKVADTDISTGRLSLWDEQQQRGASVDFMIPDAAWQLSTGDISRRYLEQAFAAIRERLGR